MSADRGTFRRSGTLAGPVVCTIAPPSVLVAVAQRGQPEERDAALKALASSEALRAERDAVTGVMRQLSTAGVAPTTGIASLAARARPARKQRSVHDVEHGGDRDLPGRKVRGEGDPPSGDPAVDDSYDGAGVVYDFYRDVYGRDSIDGHGLELVSSVHYGTDHDNAAWSGMHFQMIYGDGSGRVFARGALTAALDVTAHEFTHGIIQFSAALIYSRQPGALNESFADVFGCLTKQYRLGQTAKEADWLIGAGIWGSAVQGEALRSMRAPGTAHQFDTQPGHMRDFADLPDDGNPENDRGGVHINSGIPNRAFYLAATAIGGNAWERAGRIWYTALVGHLQPFARFTDAAQATADAAAELYGDGGEEQEKVLGAWQDVGVL